MNWKETWAPSLTRASWHGIKRESCHTRGKNLLAACRRSHVRRIKLLKRGSRAHRVVGPCSTAAFHFVLLLAEVDAAVFIGALLAAIACFWAQIQGMIGLSLRCFGGVRALNS